MDYGFRREKREEDETGAEISFRTRAKGRSIRNTSLPLLPFALGQQNTLTVAESILSYADTTFITLVSNFFMSSGK